MSWGWEGILGGGQELKCVCVTATVGGAVATRLGKGHGGTEGAGRGQYHQGPYRASEGPGLF